MNLAHPLLLATTLALSATAPAQPTPPGYTALFNGQNLDGWWGADTEDPRAYMALPPAEFQKKHDASLADIRQHWTVENGELVNDGHGLFLTTDAYYGDFELHLDYNTVPLADSGVYLRGCPQVQIWDYTDPKKFHLGSGKGSGALWNNSKGAPGKDPLVLADKPFGQWNHLRIIMTGSRVWVWLNDQLTVDGAIMENYYDRKLPVPPRGPIQLQTHGREIRWRNIHLREIPPGEATRLLRDRDPADTPAYTPILTNRDLSNWTGALDAVRLENNTLAWQPKKSGALYTKTTHANYTVRLEFKLPPGANNGLAIRYPGSGDPAYAGMCEIQILDDNYEKNTGKTIDPRQAHGSAYGMAPAHRGYQRPPGEWNYQEVTVRGATIKVELNGTPILDADLSLITEYLDAKPHPGKNRATGHFGLAGHNDPVQFRNIEIKELSN